MRPIPEAAVLLLAVDDVGAEATDWFAYGHWAILCPGCLHLKHVCFEATLLLLLGLLL